MRCFSFSLCSRAAGGWLIALVVASVLSPLASAQDGTGTIKGTVQTTNGQPAPGVNVVVEEEDLGSTSNEAGRYVLRNVPTGSHTVVVSHVGLETKTRTVRVKAGETTTVSNITLSKTTEQLDALVVEAGEQASFSADASEYVAKMPLSDLENPQVYNTVTADLMDSQVVTDFEEAMTNAPGIFKLWESTGRGGDGAGYYSLRGFSVQPTMQNGLPALTNGSPDPANIKRVEIIKGPSGTLYGSSLISYGGLINVVTKKPRHSSLGGEVSYKTGSFGLNRITADVNTPIGDDLALRVNGAFDSKDSFQDAGFHRSFFLAPSLSYKPTDKLSFLVNTEFYQSDQTNPTMLFMNRSVPLEDTTPDELGYDPSHSFTDNDLTIGNRTFNLQGRMRYDLSEQWTAETVVSRSSASSDGYYSYLWDLQSNEDTFTRYFSNENSTTVGTDLQQNLIGDFELFGLSNEMVVGVDYFQQNVVNNSTGFVGVDQVSVPAQNPAGLSRAAVDTALASASETHSKTRQATYSAYASDVVHVQDWLSVMASLRIDRFDQDGNLSSSDDDYKQTALSPKFGVVVKPLPDRLSLFANYMDGFSNVEPKTQGDGTTATFEPEHARQWETGVKTDLFDERLTATISYYDITVSNVVRQDPDRANFSVQNGEIESRGIETSLTAAPVAGLNLIAGYSYNESENVKTDPEFTGRRPAESGPKHLVNAWVRYRISSGVLDGLGVGIGGNYASENVVVNRESTGQFTLPSYTVLNASVSYDAGPYRLDLKVDNLTDKEYYKGWTTINPQAPRSVKASASYSF